MNGKLNKDNDELKDISPLLSQKEKVNPFSVPENYFDGLAFQIQERILQEKNRPSTKSVWATLLQPKFSLTACALLLVVGTGVYFKLNQPATVIDPSTVAVSYEDIKASGIVYDMDESLIADELFDNTGENVLDTTADSSEEDYILDQTNLNDIVNEL